MSYGANSLSERSLLLHSRPINRIISSCHLSFPLYNSSAIPMKALVKPTISPPLPPNFFPSRNPANLRIQLNVYDEARPLYEVFMLFD